MFPRLPELQELSGWGGCAGPGIELDDPQGDSMILQFRGQQGRGSLLSQTSHLFAILFLICPLSPALTGRWTLLTTSFLTNLFLFATWL